MDSIAGPSTLDRDMGFWKKGEFRVQKLKKWILEVEVAMGGVKFVASGSVATEPSGY